VKPRTAPSFEDAVVLHRVIAGIEKPPKAVSHGDLLNRVKDEPQ
jgi:hypothetical protein